MNDAELTRRVWELENTIWDLLRILNAHGTIDVSGPDHSGHLQDRE